MKTNIYKRNLLVPFLKMIADIVFIELAVLFSYYLRFYSSLTEIFPVTKGYPPFKNYFFFSLFLVAVMAGLFATMNAYRSRFFSTFTQDVPAIFKTCFLGILFAMSGAFLYRDFSYSRLVFVLIFFNTNIFLLTGRFFFHRLKRKFLTKGFNVLRVCLVGSAENIARVYQRLITDKNYKFDIAGYVADSEPETLVIPRIGKLEDLPGIAENEPGYDGMIITFNQEDHSKILQVIQATEGKNLELFYIPDILDLLTHKLQTLEVSGVPLLQLKAFVLSGWQGFLKRTFDVVVSAIGLILLFPFFLIIALIIKATSPGPVFYVQKRVSLDGQEFNMLKFRSMRADAEAESGPVWAEKDDPRITAIGKFLRRSSLDELPQLINVLKGEMSLVGPRPERQHFVEQFREYIPQYRERHRVRCGMTGWAQVNGLRGQSPIEERTRYDLYYIENWSLWFDLKIILLTFMEVARGENAY
jgi:exopolysaccharide biosynthesis polyprenyl glycosylphosphotransferase